MNSDNMKQDEDKLTHSGKDEHSQVLQKVVVPIKGRSSKGSSLSSVRDQSSEYETPATSVAVTPAEYPIKKEFTSQGSANSRRKSLSNMNGRAPAKGKRKRTKEDEFLEADALLAQNIQEEEYEEQKAPIELRKGKRKGIQDSEDDEPFSSSAPKTLAPTMSSSRRFKSLTKIPLQSRLSCEQHSGDAFAFAFDDDESISTEIPKPKKAKATSLTALPSRIVRDSARLSLEKAEIQRVLDSEDSDLSMDLSDVSLFASGLDSDAFEESGTSDEDFDQSAHSRSNATASTPGMARVSMASAIASTAVRRRSRDRATRTANASRHRRRLQGVEDRVSSKNLFMSRSPGTDDFRRPGNVLSWRTPIQKSERCGIH